MENRLVRRKGLSQKRFKPSFLQSPTHLQESKTPTKVTIKRPAELEAVGVVPWMEIYTEGRRAVVLHQALLKSQHRHVPRLTRSKDPAQVLSRGKTPDLTKRYCHLLAARTLHTAEATTRPLPKAASRPSVSAYSSPMNRNLWSREQSQKLLIEGLSPRSTSPFRNLRIETDSATPTSKQRQRTAVPQRSCRVTYFNTAAVIPAQPINHLTVLDIRRYIDYLDQPPFR